MMYWEGTDFGRWNCYGGKSIEELGLFPDEVEYYYDGKREMNNEFIRDELPESIKERIQAKKPLDAADKKVLQDLYDQYNYGLYAHYHSFISSVVGTLRYGSKEWPRDLNMTDEESECAIDPSVWPKMFGETYESFMKQVDQIVYGEGPA